MFFYDLCDEVSEPYREKREKKEKAMAQGEFTKEEAKATRDAVNELFDAIPKSKRFNYLGHLNDILLFLGEAEIAAPDVVRDRS